MGDPSKPESRLKSFERDWDYLRSLWRRRPGFFFVILILGLGFITFEVYRTFLGIPNLKERITGLEVEITEVKRERDSKSAQLAPFLAVANREFKDVPEEKRLDLLIPRVEQAIRSLEATAKNINAPRQLSEQQVVQMVNALRPFSNLSCNITTQNPNYEVMGYARQLESIFRTSGWTVGFQGALLPVSIQGVLVEFDGPVPNELAQALMPIWTSFGHKPTANIQTNKALGSLHYCG
jgi:hypothetical protein